LRGRGRGGLARCLPGEPVGPWPWRGRDRRGGVAWLRAFPGLDVAEHGGAGLRRVAARAQRPVGPRRAGPRPGSTAWACTACTGRFMKSSPTSTRLPRLARERYACFDHFSGDDAQAYGFAAAFGAGEGWRVGVRWSSSSSTCSDTPWSTHDATACSLRMSCSTLSRMPDGAGGGGVLPHDVQRAGLVLEPA
jgi:hypothetical protein